MFIEPGLNHITSPYLGLRPNRVRCGIVPRSSMLPSIGHPRGPGGRRRLRLGLILRWRKRSTADEKKNIKESWKKFEENSMTSRIRFFLSPCLSLLKLIWSIYRLIITTKTLDLNCYYYYYYCLILVVNPCFKFFLFFL